MPQLNTTGHRRCWPRSSLRSTDTSSWIGLHSLPRRSLLPRRDTPSTAFQVDAWSLGYREGRRHGGQLIDLTRRAGVNPHLNLFTSTISSLVREKAEGYRSYGE